MKKIYSCVASLLLAGTTAFALDLVDAPVDMAFGTAKSAVINSNNVLLEAQNTTLTNNIAVLESRRITISNSVDLLESRRVTLSNEVAVLESRRIVESNKVYDVRSWTNGGLNKSIIFTNVAAEPVTNRVYVTNGLIMNWIIL